METVAKSRCTSDRERRKRRLSMLPDHRLFKKAVTAIKLHHQNPKDPDAQQWRNLIWFECFRRNKEHLFTRALKKVQASELKRLRRRKG